MEALEAAWRRVPTALVVVDGAQITGYQFAAFLAAFAKDFIEAL